MKELDSQGSTRSFADDIDCEPADNAHTPLSELLAALSVELPSMQRVRPARTDVIIIPEVRTSDIDGVIREGYRHGLSLVARASAKATTVADAVSAASCRIHQFATERLTGMDE